MSRSSLRSAAAAALFVLTAARGVASAQSRFDVWTTEHGLPQASVVNVVQTPDGFLWASTLGGLARFDGLRFRVFDTATNPELPTSRLAAIFVDDTGVIWVVTQDRQLLRFDGATFQLIGRNAGLPAGPVIRTTRQRDRLVVETTTGAALLEHGRLAPDTRPGPAPSLGLKEIGAAPDGARWFVDGQGIGYRYDGDRLTRRLPLPPERDDRLYEDRAGRVWLRDTRRGELLCVVDGVVRRYGARDGVVGVSTVWVKEDDDGTLWFAEQGGLIRYRDGQFTMFTKADGLPDNYVNSVFRDREGSMWVATQRGLARMRAQPVTTYSVEQGLAARNTYPILQDRRGDLWIGGWTGLTRRRQGVLEDVSAAAGVTGRNVLSLHETRDGAIYIGMYGGGIRRVTVERPDARMTSAQVDVGRDIGAVHAIYERANGELWAGTEGGAFRFGGELLERALAKTAGASVFLEDASGLWIGTTDGLARYANGAVTEVGAAAGFPGKRVRMLHADRDGALWIGTYDSGLFRYKNNVFTRFTTADGLPSNGAFQILEDAESRFWISSNSGIYRVAKAELNDVAAGRLRRVTAVRYGRDDGMANQECNGLGRPAGVLASDGRLWFPTQDGVAVIDSRQAGRLPAPPVAILSASVGGMPVTARDRIEIRSGSTSVDVQYAALTFVRPDLAQFKYRMEGLETEWNLDRSGVRTARYARLPYGTFTFHVIAANREGVWNDAGASLTVVVVPPFWRTTWFLSLVVMAVMAAGFAAHRVRLGVIERKRAVQEAFARQLIDSQETDRRRIASELHDGVSQTLVVIRNWSQMAGQSLGEDTTERRRLGDIANAASQALGEVREVVQDLVPYHLERQGLAASIRDAAARVADASGITIECELAEVAGLVSDGLALRLFRVVQEGLNNIVKHSGATHATITLTEASGRVQVTIRDDGRGFDPGAVTPTSSRGGFGLVGMLERTRMMGGEMTVESAPGRGTSIIISVPLTPARRSS